MMVPYVNTFTTLRKNEAFNTIVFLKSDFDKTTLVLNCKDNFLNEKKSFEIEIS